MFSSSFFATTDLISDKMRQLLKCDYK